MSNRRLVVYIFLLAIFTPEVGAYPGTPLRLEQLVQASDTIAVVNIGSVRSTGEVSIDVDGNRVNATSDVADARLIRLIKGTCRNQFSIDFSTPMQFVGYPGVSTGTQIVFVRGSGDKFTFADRHYPSLPAANRYDPLPTGSDSISSDPLRAVVDEMGLTISSSESPLSEKVALMDKAYAVPNSPSFISSLLAGLSETNNAYLRALIDTELIRRNNTSQLPSVIELLMNSDTPSDQKQNLLSAIANKLTNPEAVPMLSGLLRSGDTQTRRAASEALWHIADPSSKAVLAGALADGDLDVKYHAVRALAEIAGQEAWAPSVSEFEEHQQKYLGHWNTVGESAPATGSVPKPQ